MIRNEVFQNGVCVSAEVIDTAAQTLTVETNGVLGQSRPLTAAEIDVYVTQPQALANKATIKGQAATALTNNATYLAIASPTNAQIAAQVKALTQQNNKLIRLAINRLEATT